MVGGATMIGFGRKEQLIAPKARPGDKIVVSKGPAIETTGLMSAYFPKYLADMYGKDFVKKAQDVYYQMSTVKDAQVAASVGGGNSHARRHRMRRLRRGSSKSQVTAASVWTSSSTT